jgi:Asp-tRNA(Asn)/Glu-tRNA(Gln) amidotransferase A subunit family amidase
VALTDRLAGLTLDPDVADGFERARRALERLGARVVRRRAPAASTLADTRYGRIFDVDLWAYHRRFAGRADLYRPAIAQLVESASMTDPADGYFAALKARDRVTARWTRWFRDERVDLILEPTAPIHAPARNDYEGSVATAVLLAFTPLWNATGFPVVALPAGVGKRSGLPVGISLIGPRGAEAGLVRAAVDLQGRALRPPGIASLAS